MVKQSSDWREYQRDVASFLEQLGFSVQVEEKVRGARGEHDVDVTARITVATIPQLWLVECKRWRRPVPKERVLTFIGVVNDIGADRGLLFSESGFQAGAIRVATNTNVTLTSLLDFHDNATEELMSLKVRVLDENAAVLNQKFMAIHDLGVVEQNNAWERYASIGLPDRWGEPHISTVLARISQLRHSLEEARFGRWPVAYFALDGDYMEFIDITHWDGLLYIATETISTCQRIYDYMMSVGGLTVDWDELQTPGLKELLRTIRRRQS